MDDWVTLTIGLDGGSRHSSEIVSEIGRTLGIDWPEEFAAFLAESGGGEGWIGESYLVVWPPGEIAPANEALGLHKFAPHLVGFGGDGGSELFAFDRSFDPVHIVMVPLVGLDDPVDFGSSFVGFLRRLQSGDIYER